LGIELAIRFVVGGAAVSLFALAGGVFKPQSFAGLFGAAPSIALATLVLTIASDGEAFAATESRSMMAGAIALGLSALAASQVMLRWKVPALWAAAMALPVWLGWAFVLWALFLR